jgi:hypothetical protein
MRDDINVDVSPEVLYVQYAVPDFEFPAQQIIAGTAITSLNGLTGPTITLAAGTSGFSYVPAGTTVTLTSPLTTKGDIYTHDATNGIRLAVGSNNARLAADSAQATGLVWINASTGWGASSGTLSRAAYASYAGQTVSVGYVQAEAQSTDDAVKLLSQTVAALITDLRTQKLIGT